MIKDRTQNTEHRAQRMGRQKAKAEVGKKRTRALNYNLLDEKGIALVLVLVLSLIALSITAALLFMASQETRFSGFQKRYKSALEANLGAAEIFEHMVILRQKVDMDAFIIDLNTANPNFYATLYEDNNCTGSDVFTTSYTGIETKIRTPTNNNDGTAQWSAACNRSITIDALDNTTYDFSIDLGANPVYRAYAKIVDTAEGNAAEDRDLIKQSVEKSEDVASPHLGYLYSIEVLAQDLNNPNERARTSILFEY
ncbi:hypothetical protein BMS3Bbin08_01643 [bacterium BMS3Bbin08]|nr:hypothetical protein BMS3Bbin08_01643 [bacterium BMS3Bbin08]